MRSIVAASRAADRAKARRENAIDRGNHKLDRISDQLDIEIAGDLGRILSIETKLKQKPITFGEFAYQPETDKWTAKQFANSTGKLKWSFTLSTKSDVVSSGHAIDDNCRSYELKSVAITQWCVLAAFIVRQLSDGRATKLINKSSPARGKAFLIADGVALHAIDGNLDAQIPVGSSLSLVAAFPLPIGEPRDLVIEFLLKRGSARVHVSNLPPGCFSSARNSPSLVENVRVKFQEAASPTRSAISSTRDQLKRSRSSGSIWLWVLLLLIIGFIALS